MSVSVVLIAIAEPNNAYRMRATFGPVDLNECYTVRVVCDLFKSLCVRTRQCVQDAAKEISWKTAPRLEQLLACIDLVEKIVDKVVIA